MFEEDDLMNVEEMKTTTFNKPTEQEWKESAVHSLRGMPFEKLITKTIEGIDLQPLYTKENTRIDPSITAIRTVQKRTGWVIAQPQNVTSGEAFITDLINSLNRGNEAIVYDGNRPVKWDRASLGKLARLATSHPIYMKNITKNDGILNLFELIPQGERSTIQGAVSFVEYKLSDDYLNVRTEYADVTAEHLRGADAVTELALVIAEAAQLALNYATFDDFSKAFFVRFLIDTHFFMEIAKIRAFRSLWQTLGLAFGENETSTVPVLCETSLRTYSKLDPYVNLLRAGNETFSAVLGGADVITVHPHDLLTGTNAISERLARNVQLVIKEETLIDKVVDPAGGSYFVETLTTELVEKAWAKFLEIDKFGGYQKFVASGKLATELHALNLIRNEHVANGVQSLIGTNRYADSKAKLTEDLTPIKIEGRLAEPFEQLRTYFSKSQPTTILLTVGELKDFKPKVDFVSSFLATGGIESTWSPSFTKATDVVKWLANHELEYVIVCGKEEVVKTMMPELLNQLPRHLMIDVAGKYEETLIQEWTNAGLNGLFYNKQDKVAKLTAIKNDWNGGKKH